jgi:hypothetical protein
LSLALAFAAFAHARYGSLLPSSGELLAALVAISVGFAWLTYHYIEEPIRLGYRQAWIAPALAATIVLIGTFGVLDIWQNGFPQRIAAAKRDYLAYFDNGSPIIQGEHKYVGQDECNFYNVDSPVPTIAPRKAIDPSCYTKYSNKSVLITGD